MIKRSAFRTLAQKLADESRGDDTTGCVLWTGHVNGNGYGWVSDGSRSDNTRRVVLTHRAAWELAYGPIPKGLCACHKCDVRRCINPAHLFLGTRAENQHDMKIKGRAHSGNRKLSKTDVILMRKAIAAGDVQRRIAASFGVSPATVTLIKQGKAHSRIA